MDRREIFLKDLPHPDRLKFSTSKDHTVLINNDGSDLFIEVISCLKNLGWSNFVVLNYPEISNTNSKINENITSVDLKDLSENSIVGALNHIRNQSSIDSAVFIIPSFAVGKNKLSINRTAEKFLKHIYFLTKHLYSDLNQNRFADSERHALLVITQMDGKLGIGGKQEYDPVQGGYYGFLKTVNVEWQNVFCRIVDFDPTAKKSDKAECIAKELLDPNLTLLEVSYANGDRYTIGTRMVNNPLLQVSQVGDISPEDVFLVSGGGKGVTASCVLEIAKKYKNRFVLIGRSEIYDKDPEWSDGIEDVTELKKNYIQYLKKIGEKPVPKDVERSVQSVLSSREIRLNLEKITAAGAKVIYRALDVMNQQQMVKLADEIRNQYGHVTAIMHGAGVLADKLIHKKSESEYERVYATKIEGLKNLLAVFKIETLKHLILFSSSAGFYGNEAQSDYALANEILNKIAHLSKKQHPGCHVISINWGPWDMGMVTPQLKTLFKERGIQVIPEAAGTEILCNELSNPDKSLIQTVVGSSMVVPVDPRENKSSEVVFRSIYLKDNPTLKDHVVGGEVVLPVVFALSWIGSICEQRYPGYSFSECNQMQVLKGIVFKEQQLINLEFELKPIPSDSRKKIALDVTVSHRGNGKLPMLHYKCQVTLSKERLTSEKVKLPETDHPTGISHPKYYTDGTLFHGPSLQGIKKVLSVNKQQMVVMAQNKEVSIKQQGQIPITMFNHYGADIMLQAVVVWARLYFHNASLPLQVGQVRVYKMLPFNEAYYIKVSIKNANQTKVVSNIMCFDVSGNLIIELTDVSITLSASLNKKFLENKVL